MYCPKQGLTFFRARRYQHENPAFDDYSQLPRPFNNLALMLEGSVSIESAGEKMEAHPGDLLFIPKGSCYTSHWFGDGAIRFFTLHFDFSWQCDPFRDLFLPVQVVRPEDPARILALYDSVNQKQSAEDSDSFLFNRDFYDICGAVFPRLISKKNERTSAVLPALEYLAENYREKISVKELAALCHLSEARFYVCFKAATGTSPIDYKNRLCIQHTMHALLTENKSIEAIAFDHGFESAIYFRRLFKSVTGCTPGEYRKNKLPM